jgi:hypothetical protein
MYCILVRPGCKMSTHHFCCLGGSGAVKIKIAPGHVILNLCFLIRWDLWVTLCILVRPGRET